MKPDLCYIACVLGTAGKASEIQPEKAMTYKSEHSESWRSHVIPSQEANAAMPSIHPSIF